MDFWDIGYWANKKFFSTTKVESELLKKIHRVRATGDTEWFLFRRDACCAAEALAETWWDLRVEDHFLSWNA